MPIGVRAVRSTGITAAHADDGYRFASTLFVFGQLGFQLPQFHESFQHQGFIIGIDGFAHYIFFPGASSAASIWAISSCEAFSRAMVTAVGSTAFSTDLSKGCAMNLSGDEPAASASRR